jgi:hypothetical protein
MVLLNLDEPSNFTVRVCGTTCGNVVNCVSRGAILGQPCPLNATAIND